MQARGAPASGSREGQHAVSLGGRGRGFLCRRCLRVSVLDLAQGSPAYSLIPGCSIGNSLLGPLHVERPFLPLFEGPRTVPDGPLWFILAVIPFLVLIPGAVALAVWASKQRDAQSDLIERLTKPPRGKPGHSPHDPGDARNCGTFDEDGS